MSRHQIGLQMYTLRDACAENFPGTLHKVAKLGYQGVEFSGFYHRSAAEVKKIIDDLGLVPVSSHVGIDDLRNRLPETLEFHRQIGCDYIVCPWIDPSVYRDPTTARAFIQELAEIGAEVGRQGLRFGYHNHAFELESRLEGTTALDVLFNETDSSTVLAELDLYWVRKGGKDEIQYIRQHAGRVPVVHLKDMEKGEEGFFTEVGTGLLDLDAVFAAGESAGVDWYMVEQDECRTRSPMESVKISIEHLKERGLV
ncbi:sugar phosphate isomerase/epimerase family protein [Paludifilum halophilum]|uniref:Xylose isomerase-like TIM barrel domain-containing protein n=1 Tax=Paludifilum halophilum TaxID=1642702 RepID=A0A235BA38_9BACL|nr:sugar phosphate isomerase/epimerase [Paludifilum halophilum]OYD08445.1 hypothetical protein CHM34_06330 [Paludifilum halophilum]